jgi:very-short-patch-repair endonuclease
MKQKNYNDDYDYDYRPPSSLSAYIPFKEWSETSLPFEVNKSHFKKCVNCNERFSVNNKKSSQKFCSIKCSSNYRSKLKSNYNLQNKINKEIEEFNKKTSSYNIAKENIKSFSDYLSYCNLIEKNTVNNEILPREYESTLKFDGFNIHIVKKDRTKSKLTKPEKLFYDYLIFNNLEIRKDFYYQYRVFNYRVDFYFPKLNLGIEIDGDYWHANPSKYKETDIMHYPHGDFPAIEVWNKNKIREEKIKEKIKLLRFWESEILNKEFEQQTYSILESL